MKKLILFIVVILLIPLVIVNYNNDIINLKKYGINSNKIIRIKNKKTGKIISIPIEKYLVGVLAGEMPVSFEINALKAQAIASRTYALKRINNKNDFDLFDDTSNQVYLDQDSLKEKWGNNYNENIKKINDVINDTQGEVVLFNNHLIDALFFSTSNGYTEDSKNVFREDLPYLKMVNSNWDIKEAKNFETKKEIPINEFKRKLNINGKIDINKIIRNKSKRIDYIIINNKKIYGTDFRKLFNLRSTSFDISINDEKIIFYVKGFGHGVGMSQYGANGMAKNGYDYKEILKHYYNKCEIKKIY